MRIISILNFKGGVGKSTLATNLGHALAIGGRRVLIIDCDLQANSSTLLSKVSRPTLTHVLQGQAELKDAVCPARENLDVVPSDRDLDAAAKYIVAGGRKGYYILRRQIGQIAGYDTILFDHSPSYSAVTEAALLASDDMLIPCELSTFSMQGLIAMVEKLDDTLVEHTLTMAGVVPFKVNRRFKEHLAYMADLEQTFGEKVLPAVRTDTTISKAQGFGQTVFEYDNTSKAAEDFRAIAKIMSSKVVVS